MQADGVETEDRFRCKTCKVTLSRLDSYKRHLQSKDHLDKINGKVKKAKLGRPTKDAERKKAEKREKEARER